MPFTDFNLFENSEEPQPLREEKQEKIPLHKIIGQDFWPLVLSFATRDDLLSLFIASRKMFVLQRNRPCLKLEEQREFEQEATGQTLSGVRNRFFQKDQNERLSKQLPAFFDENQLKIIANVLNVKVSELRTQKLPMLIADLETRRGVHEADNALRWIGGERDGAEENIDWACGL